jgi:surface protein
MILLQQQILSNLKDKRFIFTVDTRNIGSGSSDNHTFKLPLVSSSTINAVVNWGDGTSDLITSYNQAEVSHRYDTQGIYEITMDGVVNGCRFGNSGDKDKILNIANWGSFDVSVEQAFNGCSNLDTTATDYPVISSSNGLFRMFENCFSLTTLDVENWDVSSVTDMRSMFLNCSPLTTLNVENWDVSSVTDMRLMFLNCSSLTTLNVENWDVSSVINTQAMFRLCSSLTTLNVENWDVGNVQTMQDMFFACSSLSILDVTNWNVGNVTKINYMFQEARLFDYSLANWDINQVLVFSGFLRFTNGLSTPNYDATLISWAAQAPTNGISINFGGSKYTLGGAAEAARNTLINTYNWTITDGGGI